MNVAQIEWTEYLLGIKKDGEIVHAENRAKLNDQALHQREHELISLGYNQAMLEWCTFPIVHDDGAALTREHVEKTVETLRSKLGY